MVFHPYFIWSLRFNYGVRMRKLIPFVAAYTIVCLSFMSVMIPVDGSEQEVVYESLSLEVDIRDHYAISQYYTTYYNPTNQTKEISFTFRRPVDSMFSNLSLEIGERTYYARIEGKEIADEEYEKAKEENKTTTKVESTADPNRFSLSLNIGPGNRTTLGLRFEQIIERVMDQYSWEFDMNSMGYYAYFKDVSANVEITSSHQIIDMDTSGSTMSLIQNWQNNRSVQLSWGTSNPEIQDSVKVVWEESSPPTNGTLITYIEGDGGFFIHTFSPLIDDLGGYMAKDIIFVLDRSGSMSGNKIVQVKDAFDEIVHQIHSEDRFNVIYFNSVIEKYKETIQSADEENLDSASSYINSVEANGGTNINDALLSGLGMLTENPEAVPLIVFLTDGNPTSGQCQTDIIRENILAANEQDASIYSLGFGGDLDFDFIEALSLENSGFAISIPVDGNAGELMTGFYDTISVPLLKNIRFNYTAGSFDVLPTRLPSLFQGSEAVVVGRFDPDSDYITSTVKARTSQGERVFEENFRINGSDENDHIPRLWAYRKIESLVNTLKVVGEDDNITAEIISLAENYSFVTDYTSFILVVDGGDENQDPEEEDNENSPPFGLGIIPSNYTVDSGSQIDSDGDGLYDNSDPYPYDPTNSNSNGGEGSSEPCSSPLESDQERVCGFGDDSVILYLILLPVIMIVILIISIFIYTRIRKERLLEQENRKKIYDHIRENPGDYFRSIQRAVDLEVGTLSHHINILEKEQLIVSEQDGANRRFYPAGVKMDHGVKLSRIQENILKSIRKEPGLTQSQIATKCGVSRKVVFYHVKFLRDTGAVREEKVMKKPRYYPN